MQLDAVEPRLLGALSRIGVADDDGLDLRHGQRLDLPGEAEEEPAHLVIAQSRRYAGLIVRMLSVGREEGVGSQMVYLQDDRAALLVHRRRQLGHTRDEPVVEDRDSPFAIPFRIDDRLLDDDPAHPASSQSPVEIDVVLGDRAVLEIGEVHVLRRLHDAIPELHPFDLHRFEDLLQGRRAGHSIPPSLVTLSRPFTE